MKNLLTAFLLFTAYLLPNTASAQAIKYFHDRIDTTIYATTTGTNTYTGTNTDPNFNVAGYIRGLMVSTVIVNGNTGASTYRLVTRTGTLPSVAIKKQNGAALVSGDIPDSTAVLLIYYGSFWRLVGIHAYSTSITVGSTPVLSGTSGAIPFNGAGVYQEDATQLFWENTNNGLGIGTNAPTASKLKIVANGNDSSLSSVYITRADGVNLLGLSNSGSLGINCLAGQPGVVRGYVSDCALEVCSRTNEANNSFIFAAKSYSATQTYFRIRSNSQAGFIGELYQGWKHFGSLGFNINPDSSRQVQIKGWNASSSWYPIVITNGSNTNLFNIENSGHVNSFGFFTTNRLATNASIATVTGGMAINTVKTTIAASGDGSAALRICGTDAFAAGNGGSLSFEAVYDASNKYAMATILGIKENGTSGNSAGALVFTTHTSGIGSMTERLRITSDGKVQLAENSSLQLNEALSADGKYTGTSISGTAGTTLAFGDVIYLAAADSRWELADADAASTAGDVLVGMCVLAAAADGSATTILLNGTIRADASFPAFTVSAPIFISTTAGDVTQTAPAGTADVVRRMGFAITADEMYFNPSNDYITIP